MAILDFILSPELQLKVADGLTSIEAAKAAAEKTEQVAPSPEPDRYFTGVAGAGSGGFSQSQMIGAGLIIAGVVGLVLLVKS